MSLAPGPLLEGRIAVVNGAGHVTGRGIAVAFGAHGATVVIADRDPDQLSETADAIAAAGGKVIPVAADVTRRADVRRLAELAGEVDILVNHAAASVSITHPFVESNEEEWDGRYETNLKQILLCCRAVVPGMIVRARGGSVVNVSATREAGRDRRPVDSAFQGAVDRFTRSLATELGPHRIRVNAIQVPPGPDTPTEAVAGVALFLASDLSAFVTGTAIRAGAR
jgi:NAD(P)-dependent dehydrogenase (short-subunit alcohol dehydrogenase family)